jgi:hypothetical protein
MKFKSNSYYKFYNFTEHVTTTTTIIIIIIIFYLDGCPGLLTHTTTNLTTHWTSYKPSEHVRHHGVTGVYREVWTRVQRKGTSPFHR